MEESLYDFKVKDIYGEDFDFRKLKGKKIMIVNTASKCGLTSQYKGLEKLYSRYKNMNFVIIGFPANNFLWQEPGSNEKIANFCKENYGVSFPMMSKISVRGSTIHPLYKFLTDKSKNGVISSSVSWNFQKYLINEDGSIHKVISPRTNPEDPKIIDWITSS
jgi:glutathione peroxidase